MPGRPKRRVLVLGLDGADHDLVERLLADGRLPTLARLARDGAYGPLRSTIPAVTPTAWSSFVTGLNPGRHGIFNFSSNPNRGRSRLESAATRSGTPLWRTLAAAGIRSAWVTVPYTYPPEQVAGIVVSGYGGPERPAIEPASAREAIMRRHPDLVTSHHPMRERWWEDFPRYARRLIEHVDQIASVCEQAMELEPDLGVLCADFMSTDFAGHLGYYRLDRDHPAHRPGEHGEELVEVYAAVDAACARLVEAARDRLGEEPTAIILSDHGMKPIHWSFHANRFLEEAGHLRYRRRSLQRLRPTRLRAVAEVDGRLARTTRRYGRLADRVPLLPRVPADRAFAEIDFGRTRAYCYATGGQIYLGEATGARRDPRYAERLAADLAAVRHPETGEPAFEVLRKEELYRGPHVGKAPELVLLPHDERIHVDSSRRPWAAAIERHTTLDPESFYGYSGHHGVTGIVAAAGPGIRPGPVAPGAEITQMAATVLALHGVAADGLDGAPLPFAEADGEAVTVAASGGAAAAGESLSEDEQAVILERLRDLGYE